MLKTLTLILVGGLFTAAAALAQELTPLTVPTAPPDSGAATAEQQQNMAPQMRLDSVPVPANMPSLTLKTQSGVAHIWPEATRLQRMHSAAGPADTGPLLYHTNGSIVQHPFFYQVYWRPNHLQTGSATGFSSNYINVNVALGAVYNEHGIGNNNTQYFQIIGGNGAYIANDGFLAAAVLDTDPFPAAGCNDPVTPGNCLTDAQVQAELLRVIQALKWNVGPNNIFLVYTSSGEARA